MRFQEEDENVKSLRTTDGNSSLRLKWAKKGKRFYWPCVDSNSQTSVPQRSALPMMPRTSHCVMWCIDGKNLFIRRPHSWMVWEYHISDPGVQSAIIFFFFFFFFFFLLIFFFFFFCCWFFIIIIIIFFFMSLPGLQIYIFLTLIFLFLCPFRGIKFLFFDQY